MTSDERCGCRDGRGLDKLLMDYLLFRDDTAAEAIRNYRKDNA